MECLRKLTLSSYVKKQTFSFKEMIYDDDEGMGQLLKETAYIFRPVCNYHLQQESLVRQ